MPPAATRRLFRTSPTVAPVPFRALLYVSGSQASEFLNGLLSSGVSNPSRGPFYSSFLHAQGRVLHDIFVYPKKTARGHDGYFIEYDSRPSEAPPILASLKRYILRSKVRIEDVSNVYDVWAIWGSDSEHSWETPRRWNWARSGVVEPLWNPEEPWPWTDDDAEGGILRDRRGVGMGKRALVRKGDKPPKSSTHDIAGHDAYTLHRVVHGVPEGNIDIPPMQAFPIESNLDVMGGLDFRKGCYVGQELTVRTYHTGVLRKRILPVQLIKLNESQEPAQDTTFCAHSDVKPVHMEDSTSLRPRIRGTGTLLSTTQGVGLALMRLEHVELMERGVLKFQTESDGPDGNKTLWNLLPWWPDWWPKGNK